MPGPGNSSLPLIFFWNGNPTGVSTTELANCTVGSIVIDYSTPAFWQATASDNSAFNQLSQANVLTAPSIAGGLTASGSASNNFSGSTGAFLVSTGATTLGGSSTSVTNALTLNSALKVKVVNTAVAAAGSTNADAGVLTTASIQHVSSDSAAKGVILPTSVAGYELIIINDSSTACKIYPDAGGNVNGATTTSGSVTVPASKGVIATCTVALTWIVYDLTAKSA